MFSFDNLFFNNLIFNFFQSKFEYSFHFNKMMFVFLIVLFYIVSSIKYFVYFYMDIDKTKTLFFSLFYIFVFSMFLLVISFNWMTTMYAWDGLGVSSYLLIVYYHSFSSVNSGLVTMMLNRIGDIFLMIFVVSMVYMNNFFFTQKYSIFVFFLLFCALTKSAQFPFSSWLPLAMAAPTPISSLVHSSTLVTAGIFLLFQNETIFDKSFMILIFFLSLWTTFFSGLMSFVEVDLKKLIALSTLSQLSFMFLSMSLGLLFFTFLHLLIHAVFKASLFFNTGNTMHNVFSDQFFVPLKKSLSKMNSSLFFLVYFSLVGFPFSLGFYSKDQILDMSKNLNVWFFISIFFVSVAMTFVYSFRIFKILSFSSSNKIFFKNFYSHNIESFKSFLLFWMLILFVMNYFFEKFFKFGFIVVSFGWKILFYFLFSSFFFYSLFFEFKPFNYFSKMIYLALFWAQILIKIFFNKAKIMLNNDYGWIDSFYSNKIFLILNISSTYTLSLYYNWFLFNMLFMTFYFMMI